MTILLQKKVLRWKINYLGKINLTMGITHTEETSLFIFFLPRTPYLSMNCLLHFLEKKNKQKSEKKERIKSMAYFFLCVFLFVHYLV